MGGCTCYRLRGGTGFVVLSSLVSKTCGVASVAFGLSLSVHV
jgi:hypothetical protein